ncbi:MAG TPA: CRTAC1 family protein [Thermoanaerobaculia bacterium]
MRSLAPTLLLAGAALASSGAPGLAGGLAAAPPPGSRAAASPPRAAGAPGGKAAPGAAIFSDRAAEAGLVFTHVNGMTGKLYMPEMMGPGVALIDYDNDGRMDVFLVQGGPLGPDAKPDPAHGSRLFHNDSWTGPDGKRHLHFTDVTEKSGIRPAGYGMGVAVGDYDNDGYPDLYLTGLGWAQLWHNNGDGTFTDVTAKSGTANPHWGVSATFFDYDRDGFLDLYVGNYLNYSFETAKSCHSAAGKPSYCGPVVSDAVPGRLFHNRGDGTFEDVTAKAGLLGAYGPGLGVVADDFDGDGWPDLYVANDESGNQLWINQHDGTFKEIALVAGCALSPDGNTQASMGIDAGDYDGDGRDDLAMDNLTGEGDALYRNLGGQLFDDGSLASGLRQASLPFTGFGLAWLDYDNDSWLDLLVVNGAVLQIEAQEAAGDPLPLRQTKQLFHNLGNGRFAEVSAQAGPVFTLPEVSRGAAFGDVDNDGSPDVVVANNNGPARLLMNNLGGKAHWLGLRLLTGKPGRDALGARVEILRPGQKSLWRRARADGSYASANDPRVLAGLADRPAVSGVVVHWPSGRIEAFDAGAVKVDAYTTLREGTGKAQS